MTNMSFNDIFKRSFLTDYTNNVDAKTVVICLAVTALIALYIFFIYRMITRKTFYSVTFNLSLIAMTMITTMVILAVTSNVVLSLGMVGALSIVRFRTAIKEPMDIAFLFWAIAGGIVLAAGMIPLAIVGSIIIGIIMIVFCNRKSAENPFIAVITCADGTAEKRVHEYLGQKVKKAVVKSKSAQKGSIELSYEINLKGDDTAFITSLSEMEGVASAVLVSYNGDYMG